MAAFGADGRCLMRALQEELDDPAPAPCGRCAVCAGPRFDGPLDEALLREAALLLRSRPIALERAEDGPCRGRRDAEDPGGRPRRGGPRPGAAGRWRLGRARAGGPAAAFRRRARGGRGRGRAGLGRAGGVGRRGALASIGRARPGLRSPARWVLGMPFVRVLSVARDGPPQREMATPPSRSPTSAAGSRGGRAPRGPCLLVDDVRFAAGRWPWSAASCAGAAPGRSTRSR